MDATGITHNQPAIVGTAHRLIREGWYWRRGAVYEEFGTAVTSEARLQGAGVTRGRVGIGTQLLEAVGRVRVGKGEMGRERWVPKRTAGLNHGDGWGCWALT